MPNVIGIPMEKGNSQEVRSCRVDSGADGAFPLSEGMAAFWKTGEPRGIQPTLVRADNPDSTGGFAGFVFDINKCANSASYLYEAALVYLPHTEGDSWTPGERVTIDLATSYISKQGTTTNVDAYIDEVVTEVVNGKDASIRMPGVGVQILSNKQDFPPVTTAAAKDAKK